jgi:lipopolysaccharide transport protein LptA
MASCCIDGQRPVAPLAAVGLGLLLAATRCLPANAPAAPPFSSAPAQAPSLVASCHDPLCYNAKNLIMERTHAVFDEPEIVDTTRGITHITADKAEVNGADLANSHWVLTGHVVATTPQGKLQADRATIQVVARHITDMTAQGTPALFERFGPTGSVTAHGHALSVVYDLENPRVELSGDSWLTDDCGNEVSSQHIQYDIVKQRVQADAAPDSQSRVRGIIHSRSPTPCTSGLAGK